MTIPLLADFLDVREAKRLALEAWGSSYSGRLLGLLVTGELKGYLVEKIGSPHEMTARYWEKVDFKRVLFTGVVSDGPSKTGELQFLKGSFLDILYRHRDEGGIIKVKSRPDVLANAPLPAEKKKGRPPNTQNDEFWIEACRKVYRGEQAAEDGRGQTQKAFIDAMTEWSQTNMTEPYRRDTVEKKIKALWGALRTDG